MGGVSNRDEGGSMSRRRDTETLDLLSWEPPAVVHSFAPEKIRASSLKTMISKVTSAALKEAASKDPSRTREQVAEMMGEWLGEACTETMLNAYASEAREDHVPSIVRFLGIAHATGCAQEMLQALAELFGLAVVPEHYVPAIEAEMIADQVESLKTRQQAKRREWKKGPR